uniref:Uncharacterized protein n=1 Tax=viral metagenome TaxID=1070528 RepID=A0A6C0JRQ8_9ZZZZ
MSCFYRVLKLVHWVVSRLCPETRHRIEVPASKLPWFWIGTRHYDDEIITVTEVVNRAVRYNDRITPEILRDITGYDTTNWRYVDKTTLEEKDFPSSGIVIENAC